jgi:CheY-like chemotaxis protein
MQPNLAQSRLSVLLVDDDALIRDCLADLLGDVGCRVTATASAEQALQVADESKAPDVLITDVLLGRGMNGLALVTAARRRWPLVRAVLISGADIPDPVLAPSDRYLRKPFSGNALIRLVGDVAGLGRHATILKPVTLALHNPDGGYTT